MPRWGKLIANVGVGSQVRPEGKLYRPGAPALVDMTSDLGGRLGSATDTVRQTDAMIAAAGEDEARRQGGFDLLDPLAVSDIELRIAPGPATEPAEDRCGAQAHDFLQIFFNGGDQRLVVELEKLLA